MTFDAGGTLLEPRGPVGQVYAKVAAASGLPGLSPEVLTRRFRAAWRARADFNHSRAEWAEIVDATFRGLVPLPPSQTFFGELYRCFAQPEAWQVYSDVRPTLQALAARGIKLAVISNWDQRLRRLLRELDLLDHFDAVIISSEVGFTKPSPAIFQFAARELGLPPSETLHVGDELECDVRAARHAGLQALQLVRARRKPGFSQIRSLQEIPLRANFV